MPARSSSLGCFTAMAGQILVLSVLSVGAIILIALPSFIIPCSSMVSARRVIQ